MGTVAPAPVTRSPSCSKAHDEIIDRHLTRMAALGAADQRSCLPRWLLTELGMIELPGSRCFSVLKVVRAYRSDSRRNE